MHTISLARSISAIVHSIKFIEMGESPNPASCDFLSPARIQGRICRSNIGFYAWRGNGKYTVIVRVIGIEGPSMPDA
jgi:hypothetical protein